MKEKEKTVGKPQAGEKVTLIHKRNTKGIKRRTVLKFLVYVLEQEINWRIVPATQIKSIKEFGFLLSLTAGIGLNRVLEDMAMICRRVLQVAIKLFHPLYGRKGTDMLLVSLTPLLRRILFAFTVLILLPMLAGCYQLMLPVSSLCDRRCVRPLATFEDGAFYEVREGKIANRMETKSDGAYVNRPPSGDEWYFYLTPHTRAKQDDIKAYRLSLDASLEPLEDEQTRELTLVHPLTYEVVRSVRIDGNNAKAECIPGTTYSILSTEGLVVVNINGQKVKLFDFGDTAESFSESMCFASVFKTSKGYCVTVDSIRPTKLAVLNIQDDQLKSQCIFSVEQLPEHFRKSDATISPCEVSADGSKVFINVSTGYIPTSVTRSYVLDLTECNLFPIKGQYYGMGRVLWRSHESTGDDP